MSTFRKEVPRTSYKITEETLASAINATDGEGELFIKGMISGILKTVSEIEGGDQPTLSLRLDIAEHIKNFLFDPKEIVGEHDLFELAKALSVYLENTSCQVYPFVVKNAPAIICTALSVLIENKIPEDHIIAVVEQINNNITNGIKKASPESAKMVGDLWSVINYVKFGHPAQYLDKTCRYTCFYKDGEGAGVNNKDVGFRVFGRLNANSNEFDIHSIVVEFPELQDRPRVTLSYNRETDSFSSTITGISSFTLKQKKAAETAVNEALLLDQKLREYNEGLQEMRAEIQAEIAADKSKQEAGLEIDDLLTQGESV